MSYLGAAIGQLGASFLDRLNARERSERQAHAERMEALYKGTQYEAMRLAPAWTKLPPGDSTPRRFQRPAVQYNLPELLVNRPTSLLFGEGRAPKATLQAHDGSDTKETNAWLATIADEGALWFRMLIASRLCVIAGVVVVTWGVTAGVDDEGGVFEFRAHRADQCEADFDPKRHDRMVRLDKRYQFDKRVKRVDSSGRVTELCERYWHREEWTTTTWTVYEDAPVADGKEPTWVVADAVEHGFGFVPGWWCKLEDGFTDDPRGVSFLRGTEDKVEDLDRVLSQKAAAVFYFQEPSLFVFGESEEDRHFTVGSTKYFPARENGVDAEVKEYSGAGQQVAEEHINAQRNRVLEVKRVTSHDPDKVLAAARSGAALEVLNRPMVELVGEWRVPFGACVRAILGQILRAVRSGKLNALGVLETPAPKNIPAGRVMLTWGRAFPSTPDDLKIAVETGAQLVDAGLCDRETVVRWVAVQFGFDDVEEILERLEEELGQRSKRAQQMAATIGGTLPPEEDAESDDTEGDAELKKTTEEDGKPSVDKPDGEQTDTKPDTAPASKAPPKVAGSPPGEAKIFGYHLELGILRVNQILASIGMPPVEDGEMFLDDWQRKHEAGPYAPKPAPVTDPASA